MVEYVVLKESKNPFIINDYYYIKNQGDKNKTNNYIDELENHTKKEIIIERQKHICDDMKLVNTSKNLIETFNKRNSLDNIIDKKNKEKDDTNKIYGELGGSKDFDKVIKEIKDDLKTKDKVFDIKEIKDIMNKNDLKEKYYNRDYSFYVPE